MPPEKRKKNPGFTIRSREAKLISLASDLAEKKLRDGTASSQVITHFLDLGSSLAELERAKLENENLLLKARIDSLAAAGRIEKVYEEALAAMRRYSGQDDARD